LDFCALPAKILKATSFEAAFLLDIKLVFYSLNQFSVVFTVFVSAIQFLYGEHLGFRVGAVVTLNTVISFVDICFHVT
jgi:hypothetical protein